VNAGFAVSVPVSMRLLRWGRIYGPSGTLLQFVEDWWSSAVRTALKSPPIISGVGGRGGKEFQKDRCLVWFAGA